MNYNQNYDRRNKSRQANNFKYGIILILILGAIAAAVEFLPQLLELLLK